ncbi:MAG: hypothetical protein AB7U20_06755 [Planctomycetaceae bacterium]
MTESLRYINKLQQVVNRLPVREIVDFNDRNCNTEIIGDSTRRMRMPNRRM